MSSNRRLKLIAGHLDQQSKTDVVKQNCADATAEPTTEAEDKNPGRHDILKWNGWGYDDSKFLINKDGQAVFTGSRYILGGHSFPKLVDWFTKSCHADVNISSPAQPLPDPSTLPSSQINQPFLDHVKGTGVQFSLDPHMRLFHGHGHTCHEIFELRHGMLHRIPDIVIWPSCHKEVEKVVQLAVEHNVCIIPFGGGTSVSSALECPVTEKRMVVSLDMTEMKKILWVDEENLVAHIEAGIIGQELERQLNARGLCVGHEPDSLEFSSLGGWVATRASGMKKNIYGNIEDILVRVRMVTARGTVEKSCQVPRMSTGPDIHHFIMGSEGTLGVITEVSLRIRPLPECKVYGSIVFPTFDIGVACVREIAKQRCAPASIRLMDNEQFVFGQALKSESGSYFKSFIDGFKAVYLTKFKGFDPHQLAVATLLFEGDKQTVASQQRKIYEIASQFRGIPGGEENGQRGYMLTFVIAYLRDLGFDHHFLAESFETSVPWDRVTDLCRNVKEALKRKCANLGIKYPPLATCRVTQTYDAGACVYFYFGFNYRGLPNPLEMYGVRLLLSMMWLVILPAFTVWSMVGTAWVWEVMNHTPQCLPGGAHFWFLIVWQALSYLWIFVHCGLGIVAWYLERRLRRAEGDLRQLEDQDLLSRWGQVSRLQSYTSVPGLREEDGGLKASEIADLPGLLVVDCPMEDCPICLTELQPGENARKLSGCGHTFHRSCIDLWLFRRADCPLCKTEVKSCYGSPRLRRRALPAEEPSWNV